MATVSRTMAIKGVPKVIVNDYATKLPIVRLLRSTDAKLSLSFESDDLYGGNSLYPFDAVIKTVLVRSR